MLFLLIFTHQWHLTVLNVTVQRHGGRFRKEESLIVKTLNIQVGTVSLWVCLTIDSHVPALCRCDWSGLKWFLCSKRCRGREMGSVCWLLCENKTDVKTERPKDSVDTKQAAVWGKWRAFGFFVSLSDLRWVCWSVYRWWWWWRQWDEGGDVDSDISLHFMTGRSLQVIEEQEE